MRYEVGEAVMKGGLAMDFFEPLMTPIFTDDSAFEVGSKGGGYWERLTLVVGNFGGAMRLGFMIGEVEL
ncbi:hypothetical protein VDG1235_2377 [Verrucomicrobiia bacterium DG1235]|nr:hypothetical protein VDG1235_2377 [Verrucomicrobiae bacterium DG1235]